MLTPGHQHEFIEYQKAKVQIALIPIIDVKTQWNSIRELLKRAYWFKQFTRKWLKVPKYNDCRPQFTPQDEWIIIKYVLHGIRPFRYWTLCMPKAHTVTLHHSITVYSDMYGHMDGVMRALANKQALWKKDLYFTVEFGRRKLSSYYTEVPPTTGMLPISAHILNWFRNLRSFWKWDKGMDIYFDAKTCYTTQYQEAFLNNVENE